MTNPFQIVYTQKLVGDADDPNTQWTHARPDTYIQIGYSAIETGWLRKFQRHWSDLGVLIGLGLQARPLRGDDFKLLWERGLVGPADEGRLLMPVTEAELSATTGVERDDIQICMARLAASGLLKVLDLPDDFRDSQGWPSGGRAYLLMGTAWADED